MSGKVKIDGEMVEVTDLQMMQNPDWWPGIVLPLKTGAPSYRAAILTCSLNNEQYRLVEDANMFDKRWTDKESIPLKRSELQQVIDRGWRVD